MSRDGLPTGTGTGNRDVADPHPSTEQGRDRKPRPGGTKPAKGPDIGPNSYAHDGVARPEPKHRKAGPQ